MVQVGAGVAADDEGGGGGRKRGSKEQHQGMGGGQQLLQQGEVEQPDDAVGSQRSAVLQHACGLCW